MSLSEEYLQLKTDLEKHNIQLVLKEDLDKCGKVFPHIIILTKLEDLDVVKHNRHRIIDAVASHTSPLQPTCSLEQLIQNIQIEASKSLTELRYIKFEEIQDDIKDQNKDFSLAKNTKLRNKEKHQSTKYNIKNQFQTRGNNRNFSSRRRG